MESTAGLLASGRTLTAWSLAKLAELVDCASDAGDQIEWLRAVDRTQARPLTRFERERLVALPAEGGW